jgi:hypothetical protein
LKPGERIGLIRGLADALAPMEWADIDLILRQFGFPWSAEWGSTDRRAYAMHHLEAGTDESIDQLRDYLLSPQTASATVDDRGPWPKDYFRLFVSHVARVQAHVQELKDALEPCGIAAFVAHVDIKPTQAWVEVIEQALNSCDALAAHLTHDFHESEWTDQEVGFALARRVLVLPLKVECDPYGFIGSVQALPAENATSAQLAEGIFEALVGHGLTAAAIAEPVLAALERSLSFQDAKIRMQRVQRISVWTPALLRRLEDALQINAQVSGAWGVPEQIGAILSAHRS